MKFLLWMLLPALVLAFAASKTLGAEPQPNYALSLKDPAALALKIDALLDRTGKVKIDPASLYAWNAEILPWFAELGIIEEPIPAEVHFTFLQAVEANHILGFTGCTDQDVTINARYLNPVSPWYGDPGMVFTLAHELAHVQQGVECFMYPSETIETDAQLAAFVITSAIADSGSKIALVSMLLELRDMALGTLRYDAMIHPERQAALDRLYARILSPAEMADHMQRAHYWARHPGDLREILKKYVVQPYHLLAEGLKTGRIKDVVAGGTVETLSLADFAYALAHADELLREDA